MANYTNFTVATHRAEIVTYRDGITYLVVEDLGVHGGEKIAKVALANTRPSVVAAHLSTLGFVPNGWKVSGRIARTTLRAL